MKASDGYRYIFVLIDVYTLFLIATPLKNRSSEVVKAEFEAVFSKYGKPINLETDSGINLIKYERKDAHYSILGGEFTGLQSYFEGKGIHFRLKRGRTKCAYVEGIIFHLKRKLYAYMRHEDNTHWEKLLPEIVKSMNNAKHPQLGGLVPSQLTSEEKAAQIDVALHFENLPRFDRLFLKDKDEIARAGPLKVGDYVFVVLPDYRVRGYDVQVS